MRNRFSRTLVTVALTLGAAPHAWAQTPNPTGHWDGVIRAPFGEVRVAVDLTKDESGNLHGTFSNPGEQINGLPFARVTMEGRSVTLDLKTGTQQQTFKGTLSPDGASISGDFLISVYGVPFDLKRTGDANIQAAPRSPAIDRALEGTWRAELGLDGNAQPMTMTLTNHEDHTATGAWWIDEAVQIPLTIAVEGSSLKISSPVTRETYSGTFNPGGAEIVGTFREGPMEVPVTFRRAR